MRSRPSAAPASRRGGAVTWAAVAFALALVAAVVVLIVNRSDTPAASPQPSTSSVTLDDGWVRATADSPQSTVSAVFGVLRNVGEEDRFLVSASSSAAANAQLQRYTGSTGTPQFEAVPALTVPAGGTAALSPEGVRLLLLGAAEIEPGSTVYLRLEFDDGSTVDNALTARTFEEVDLDGGWWHGDHFHPAEDDSHGPPPTG